MPAWMNIIVKINPLTYSVDMFKHIILEPEKMSEPLREAMGLDIEVFGHVISFTGEVIVVGLIGALFVVLATIKFSKTEA